MLSNHFSGFDVVRIPICLCFLRLVDEILKRLVQTVVESFVTMERELGDMIQTSLEVEQVDDHV